MKIGDKLICHSELSMRDPNLKLLTINKIYEVEDIIDNCVIIINDYGQHHWFDINLEESNYRKWFYSERKIKLDKIKKISDEIFK